MYHRPSAHTHFLSELHPAVLWFLSVSCWLNCGLLCSALPPQFFCDTATFSPQACRMCSRKTHGVRLLSCVVHSTEHKWAFHVNFELQMSRTQATNIVLDILKRWLISFKVLKQWTRFSWWKQVYLVVVRLPSPGSWLTPASVSSSDPSEGPPGEAAQAQEEEDLQITLNVSSSKLKQKKTKPWTPSELSHRCYTRRYNNTTTDGAGNKIKKTNPISNTVSTIGDKKKRKNWENDVVAICLQLTELTIFF